MSKKASRRDPILHKYRFLTLGQAAIVARVPMSALLDAIKAGTLSSREENYRATVIESSALERWIDERDAAAHEQRMLKLTGRSFTCRRCATSTGDPEDLFGSGYCLSCFGIIDEQSLDGGSR